MASKLIHLSQILGGKALEQNVQSLLTSYQAYKVLTDISKGEGLGVYNVNELLTSLKTVVDAQLGEGAGSVDDRIQAAKDDLQAKVDLINGKAIKDIVRLTGTFAVAGGTATLDQAVETAVPGIDTSKPYGLYYSATNKPVLGADGLQVKYDFATGQLVGVPSIADPADIDPTNGVSYIPVAADFAFKVFPVGSFTFETLPVDYLLDNAELAAVSYDQAIDKIVTDLAQDQQLIDSIKALVGTETVQNQITAITGALETRLGVAEGKLDVLMGADTVEGSIAKAVKDAVAAEAALREAADTANANAVAAEATRAQAAEAALQQAIDDEEGARLAADAALQSNLDALGATVEANRKTAHNSDQNILHDIALINAVKPVLDKVTVATDEQILIQLTKTPTADPVIMYVNGQVYFETDAFTVDRVLNQITWTFRAINGGFDLLTNFDVVVSYKNAEAVADAVLI